MSQGKRHLYLHVPFCDGKCAYCAFYSVRYSDALATRYLDALEREVAGRADCGEIGECATIYIGGGTPSLLSDRQWERLLAMLIPYRAARCEWTVEVNPGTLPATVLSRLVAAGVNRISMGVQSFNNEVLKAMGRRHTACDVGHTLDRIRAAGIENVGLDLITGLPGVDADGWAATLAETVALEPTHVSVYGLGIEAGTRLEQRVRSGRVMVPDEAVQIDALGQAEGDLVRAEFRHYEVSNYARPGWICAHNLACWKGEDYVGLGPAAASRVGLERRMNDANVEAYADALLAGTPPPAVHETLDRATDLVERLMFGFRLDEGVAVAPRCEAAGDTGIRIWQAWRPLLKALAERGLLEVDEAHWKVTPRGRMVLDRILEQLVLIDA